MQVSTQLRDIRLVGDIGNIDVICFKYSFLTVHVEHAKRSCIPIATFFIRLTRARRNLRGYHGLHKQAYARSLFKLSSEHLTSSLYVKSASLVEPASQSGLISGLCFVGQSRVVCSQVYCLASCLSSVVLAPTVLVERMG